ncbi:MAG TPA: SDR family oxidoreductase [Kiloniellaceae bacterium]|nr:SDR family oxidoreductase [Kiloniellaceae bacterium]
MVTDTAKGTSASSARAGILTKGAVALVTGASSGIGEVTAKALLARGLKVICTSRRGDRLGDIFGSYGDAALPLSLDVTDAKAVAALPESLPENFAEVDILIASAGSDVGGRQAFGTGSMDDWAGTVDANVTGLMRICHAVIPGMLARGRGHVVTIGSIAGLRTYPGGAVYAATKHAVRAFTEALRQDYCGDPIRITEILPGVVRTGFAEARHRGDSAAAAAFYDAFPACLAAEDIAEAILFALGQPAGVNIAQLVITPTGDKKT